MWNIASAGHAEKWQEKICRIFAIGIEIIEILLYNRE